MLLHCSVTCGSYYVVTLFSHTSSYYVVTCLVIMLLHCSVSCLVIMLLHFTDEIDRNDNEI